MIHPTAIVAPGAEIAPDAEIGPYAVIGPRVTVGAACRIMSHVALDGWLTVGAGCTVFPFACLGSQTQDLKFKGESAPVEIGPRTTIREYVTVNSGTTAEERTRVGAECHIMAYSHVAHGTQVGDGVIMANGASLSGHVVVEAQAVIGGLTGVHQFVRIGRLCMIGGMARVVKDCPPFMLVEGNPSEVRGLNRIGLERRGVNEAAQHELKQCYRLLYREGLSTSQALERIRAEVQALPEVSQLVAFIEASERGIIK